MSKSFKRNEIDDGRIPQWRNLLDIIELCRLFLESFKD